MTEIGLNKILVLDDDADFRKLLKTHLKKQFNGVKVEEYDPVESGAPDNDFDWSRYEVLVLDYNLSISGVTGLDILQANRQNQLFPAAIMLTGAGNEEVAVRALKSGVFDYLRKENLDKEMLHDAIVEAYEKHGSRLERLNEFTNQSQAFNKALFYQQLEEHQQHRGGLERVLLIINLDNHQLIGERAGLILRDNIIRHIAKQAYNIFQMGNCNPLITRLSDITIALLIDDPGAEESLKFNLKGLCDHLQKRPYKYEDQKFRFTASIGVVRLDEHEGSAEAVIQAAHDCCALAQKQDGNSFYIYTGKESPAAETAAAKAKTDAAEVESKQAEAEPEEAELEPVLEEAAPAKGDGGTQAKAEAKQTPPKQASPAPAAPAPAKAAPEKKAAAEAAAGGKSQKPTLDDGELEESELTEEAQVIKRAFDEKRIMQTFQSVIPLFSSEEEGSTEAEAYYASLEMLNTDGSVVDAEDILEMADIPAFHKYIDRWMLREAIGRVVNAKKSYLFLIPLSRDSLADPGLFNWLRYMLSGFDQRRPGQSIALEINAADFGALQKPASALISYLYKTHGFKFVLGGVTKEHDLAGLCKLAGFNIIRVEHKLLCKLSETQDKDGKTVIDSLKAKGIQFIADDIEDAMDLTTVIGTGADFARGTFIGEPGEQVDDQTNVESVEIV